MLCHKLHLLPTNNATRKYRVSFRGHVSPSTWPRNKDEVEPDVLLTTLTFVDHNVTDMQPVALTSYITFFLPLLTCPTCVATATSQKCASYAGPSEVGWLGGLGHPTFTKAFEL